MKRILPLLIAVLLIAKVSEAQFTATYGTVVTSLSTTSTGAVTGTAFAVPSSYAALITWSCTADGSALSVALLGSIDNSTYFSLDTSTVAAGAIRNFGFTAVKFVRVDQVSRTGGTLTTCTIVTSRGFITGNGIGNLQGLNLTGQLLAGDGSAALPSYSFSSLPTTGWYLLSGTTPAFSFSGSATFYYNGNGIVSKNYCMDVSSATVCMEKDASDIFAHRRGTNAQSVRFYNTFTSAANYERLAINWASNSWSIGPEAATGTVRGGYYNYGPSSVLTISTNVITPTNSVHHLGAGLVKTITVPANCTPTCTIYIIPDAAFTTDTTGNILIASTAVIGRQLVLTWDGTKWSPSY